MSILETVTRNAHYLCSEPPTPHPTPNPRSAGHAASWQLSAVRTEVYILYWCIQQVVCCSFCPSRRGRTTCLDTSSTLAGIQVYIRTGAGRYSLQLTVDTCDINVKSNISFPPDMYITIDFGNGFSWVHLLLALAVGCRLVCGSGHRSGQAMQTVPLARPLFNTAQY